MCSPGMTTFWLISSKLLAVPFNVIMQNDGHHTLIRLFKIKGFLIKNGEWFSIIDVFWLPNLCGVGGDASFAPQADLVNL